MTNLSKHELKSKEVLALKEQLALEKSRLEVKNLRAELLMRPLSLLTPVILAVGVFAFVQAPNLQDNDQNRCMQEIIFLQNTILENTDMDTDVIRAMDEFPFSCPASRALFSNVSSLDSAAVEVDEAAQELRNLQDSSFPEDTPDDPQERELFENCVRALQIQRDERTRALAGALENEISNMNVMRAEQIALLDELRNEELTGRGPMWASLTSQFRENDLRTEVFRARIASLQAEIALTEDRFLDDLKACAQQ